MSILVRDFSNGTVPSKNHAQILRVDPSIANEALRTSQKDKK